MFTRLQLAPQHRVFAAFAAYAFAMGNFFPRLADIKQAMGVEDGALGLGLMGTPVGTLLALTFATPLLERLGFKRALLGIIPLVAATYAIAVHATGPLPLFFLLIPVGALIGCTEIIINVEADRTEAAIGRRIMNRAHSFWSIGFFCAGLFGAGMASLGLSPQVHLAIVVLVVVAGVFVFLRNYQPSPSRTFVGAGAAPRFARPSLAILVLVAVTLSAMLMEGASHDWSAIYMRTVFSAGPFLAGIAVACFAFSQGATRFFADAFVEKHSPAAVARILLCVLAAGLALVFFSPAPAASLIGFAFIGAGTSVIFPLAISAAARRTDKASVINVAAISQLSFAAFLVGPPVLGLVSQDWGIRWVYGIGAPLVALSFLAAGVLGGKQPRENSQSDQAAVVTL